MNIPVSFMSNWFVTDTGFQDEELRLKSAQLRKNTTQEHNSNSHIRKKLFLIEKKHTQKQKKNKKQ